VCICASGCADPEVRRASLELTADDLFSDANWSGATVSIHGLKIGQTRSEAIAAARSHGARLVDDPGANSGGPDGSCTSSLCALYRNDPEDKFNGVATRFSPEGKVQTLILSTIPYEFEDARKAAYYGQLHGSFRKLLSQYSGALQQELLGKEATREVLPPPASITAYYYPARGLGLTVQLTPGRAEKIADLSFAFCAPAPAARTVCEQ
jgi:hypothetical protein